MYREGRTFGQTHLCTFSEGSFPPFTFPSPPPGGKGHIVLSNDARKQIHNLSRVVIQMMPAEQVIPGSRCPALCKVN